MPTVVKVGTITKGAPELRFSPAGKPYAKFSIKEVKPYQAPEGWVGRYYDVTCFGKCAEHAAQCLTKGDRVIVTGEGKVREYTKQDGTPGSSNEIAANYVGVEITFCGVDVHRNAQEQTQTVRRPPAPAPVEYGPDEEPF